MYSDKNISIYLTEVSSGIYWHYEETIFRIWLIISLTGIQYGCLFDRNFGYITVEVHKEMRQCYKYVLSYNVLCCIMLSCVMFRRERT